MEKNPASAWLPPSTGLKLAESNDDKMADKPLTYMEILQIRDSIVLSESGKDAIDKCSEILKNLGFKRE